MKRKPPKRWTPAKMGREGGKAKATKPKGFAALPKYRVDEIVRNSIAARRKKSTRPDT